MALELGALRAWVPRDWELGLRKVIAPDLRPPNQAHIPYVDQLPRGELLGSASALRNHSN